MDEELLELEVRARLADSKTALEEADDLAWEHTKEYAIENRLSTGSAEFADAYSMFHDRYAHQVDHIKFFMLSAMLTVRQLLEDQVLAVPDQDGVKPNEQQVAEAISRASKMLTSSYMWLAAGYEVTWPVNDELPEDIIVKYYFRATDVLEEKE